MLKQTNNDLIEATLKNFKCSHMGGVRGTPAEERQKLSERGTHTLDETPEAAAVALFRPAAPRQFYLGRRHNPSMFVLCSAISTLIFCVASLR